MFGPEDEMAFRRRTNSTMTADGFRIPVEKTLGMMGPASEADFTSEERRILRVLIERQREEEMYNFPEDVVGVITPKGEKHVQEDGEGESHAGL